LRQNVISLLAIQPTNLEAAETANRYRLQNPDEKRMKNSPSSIFMGSLFILINYQR